jgi:hypothetical protein
MPTSTIHKPSVIIENSINGEAKAYTENTPPHSLATIAGLSSLPYEIRDMIYEEYFVSYSATQIVRINAHRLIVVPPIISASNQLCDETIDYFETWLKSTIPNPCVKIEA